MSTYKGKFGYVHYYVKALMERPQQAPLECKKAFDVEEPLDVNTPDLLVSVELRSSGACSSTASSSSDGSPPAPLRLPQVE